MRQGPAAARASRTRRLALPSTKPTLSLPPERRWAGAPLRRAASGLDRGALSDPGLMIEQGEARGDAGARPSHRQARLEQHRRRHRRVQSGGFDGPQAKSSPPKSSSSIRTVQASRSAYSPHRVLKISHLAPTPKLGSGWTAVDRQAVLERRGCADIVKKVEISPSIGDFMK